MILKTLRCLVVAAVATLSLSVPSAQAGTLTFTDASCNSFSMQDMGGGNFAVACNQMLCTITPNVGAPLPNWNVIVHAACTPWATTYTWTRLTGIDPNCPVAPNPGQDSTLLAPNATATNCMYRLNASDPVNGTGTKILTISWAPPAVIPSGCSIAGAPTSAVAANTAVSLSVNCSSGGVATAYSWSGGFATGATTQQVSGAVAATTTFTATASNSGGTATTAPVTVTVTGSTGGGGSISCPGWNTLVLDLNWASAGNVAADSAGQGSFGNNEMVIARFTTPAGTAANLGHISAYEWPGGGGPVPRTAALSATPCNVDTSLAAGALTQASTPNIYYRVGGTDAYYPVLQPNTTYYFNIINRNSAGSHSCGAGVCPIRVELNKPQGL